MLTKQDEKGVPRFAVWVKRLDLKEQEPITDEEICDATDTIISARIDKDEPS